MVDRYFFLCAGRTEIEKVSTHLFRETFYRGVPAHFDYTFLFLNALHSNSLSSLIVQIPKEPPESEEMFSPTASTSALYNYKYVRHFFKGHLHLYLKYENLFRRWNTAKKDTDFYYI